MFEVILVKIEKCDLKRALKHDIDIVMDICESITSKFLSSMEHLRVSHQQNASWKICKMLLVYAQHYGTEYDGKTLIQEKISQQMLADLLTIREVFGEHKGLKLCYMGDARYNTGNSLMVACAKMGMHFTTCAPKKYWQNDELVKTCKEIAA